MRSSHKQDKYLLEQAYVNLRENDNSMNPEEVVENLKRLFPKHPEVERIYDTNMDAFGEITSDVVESIAEELREAGYSTGFILQNTGIDLSITHKGGYPDGIPGIIQDDAGDSQEKENQFKVGDEVIMYHDSAWGNAGVVDEIIDGNFLSVIDQKGKYHEVHVSQVELDSRYSDGIMQDAAGDSQERVDVNHYIKKMRRYKFTDAHWIADILDYHLSEMDPDEDPIGFLQSIARHLKDEEVGMSDEKIQELTGFNPQEIGELDSGSRIGPRYSDGPQWP